MRAAPSCPVWTSDGAIETSRRLDELIVMNTIPITHPNPTSKIKILSVAPLIGEAIILIHEELSVSKLFDGSKKAQRPAC